MMFRRYGKEEVDNLKWENASGEIFKVYKQATSNN
jgi:hypothetical protein